MDDALPQAAGELGFDVIEDPDEALRFGIASCLGSRRIVEIQDVLERTHEGMRFVVATVKHYRETDTTSRPDTETLLFFSQEGLELPSMVVQPRGGLARLQSVVTRLIGMPQVEFPDDPDFNAAYLVFTLHPESTKALLDAELREYLAAHPGLMLRTESNRIAALRAGVAVPPAELPAFVDEADNVVMLAARRGRELEQLEISPQDEAAQTLEQMRGVGGFVARQMRVSSKELTEFLDQPPPRAIPATIRRGHLGFGSIFFYIWGGLFFGIGIVVVTGIFAQKNPPPPVFLIFGLFPVMGLTAIVLTYRYRRRMRRLLRDGECCDARVLDVKATNVYVNNRRRYKVTLQHRHNGLEQTATVNVYDPAVQKAFGLVKSGDSTTVLVDPGDLRRVMWIESLASR